jgi:hypothetical protein
MASHRVSMEGYPTSFIARFQGECGALRGRLTQKLIQPKMEFFGGELSDSYALSAQELCTSLDEARCMGTESESNEDAKAVELMISSERSLVIKLGVFSGISACFDIRRNNLNIVAGTGYYFVLWRLRETGLSRPEPIADLWTTALAGPNSVTTLPI